MSVSPERATYACLPCRKLKRKCTRELPVCSLCARLNKVCDYGATNSLRSRDASALNDASIARFEPNLEYLTPLSLNPAGLVNFPAQLFLDSDSHRPLAVSSATQIPVPPHVTEFLGSVEGCMSICDEYFSSIQVWFPFMSQKRLVRCLQDGGPEGDLLFALRLTCMKLLLKLPSYGEEAASLPIYQMAKQLLTIAENAALPSLDLVQSVVLLSLYEMGHGIYPSAYLRIGHAARLGTILGWHDRKHSPQLFKPADTWTEREEERRTWWAVLILDRYITLGISGVPLATPDPVNGDLLPCLEEQWGQGQIGINEPLFVESLSMDSPIGSYANTCQAAHITSRLLKHRNRLKIETDHRALLEEAQQLQQILSSLSTYLLEKHLQNRVNTGEDPLGALALTCSARLLLSNMYACNEHYPPAGHLRLPEETAMQRASIKSIEEMVGYGYEIAQYVSNLAGQGLSTISPIALHCLYLVASECAWLLREYDDHQHRVRLDMILGALVVLRQRWTVADAYLKLLEVEGASIR